MTITDTTNTEAQRLAPGTRVRITNGDNLYLRYLVVGDTIGTIEADCGGGLYEVRFTNPDNPASTTTQFVYDRQFEVVEPESEAAELRRERDEARAALAAYKEQVRTAVIEEAEQRGWCSEVDAWLEDLGLPPRYAQVPRARYSLVRIEVNGRQGFAVREDTDSQPWKVFGVPGGGHEWWSDADIDAYMTEVLHDGER